MSGNLIVGNLVVLCHSKRTIEVYNTNDLGLFFEPHVTRRDNHFAAEMGMVDILWLFPSFEVGWSLKMRGWSRQWQGVGKWENDREHQRAKTA